MAAVPWSVSLNRYRRKSFYQNRELKIHVLRTRIFNFMPALDKAVACLADTGKVTVVIAYELVSIAPVPRFDDWAAVMANWSSRMSIVSR